MKQKLTQLNNGDWIDLEKVSLLSLIGPYEVKIVVEGHQCLLILKTAEAQSYRDELAALVNGTTEPQEPADDVGEGYIALKEDDVRQEGDEYRKADVKHPWVCAVRIGDRLDSGDVEDFIYRRPIK